jgi:hypothetical protein
MDVYYYWSEITSNWVFSGKDDYTYDANWNKTLDIYYNWDNVSSLWVYNKQTTYDYDANRNNILEINYDWDEGTSLWINYSKIASTYDSNSDITSTIYYYWDNINSKWWANAKVEKSYDANRNNILDITFFWNTDLNKWVASSKNTYYYSVPNVTSIARIPDEFLKVFPNPAKEFIEFDVPDISVNVNVEIFDIRGIKVLDQNLSINKQVSVSNLSSGLYLYLIIYDRKVQSGKIIIE